MSIDKIDLDSKSAIAEFIKHFYEKVLADELLGHIFLNVAGIDVHVHLGHICNYWEKLLLGENEYQRHTMNIHRALDQKHPLKPEEFARWLSLFMQTASEGYQGPKTERAKKVAHHIAANMERALAS